VADLASGGSIAQAVHQMRLCHRQYSDGAGFSHSGRNFGDGVVNIVEILLFMQC